MFRRPGACALRRIVMEGKNLDLERVDAISKALAAATDRRGMIRNLTGAALGGILVAARVRGSEAGGKRNRKRNPNTAKLHLVRPDAPTNCDDQKISGPPRGSVSFRVEADEFGALIVANISLQNAQPHATYEVFQRCVGGGDPPWYIATNDKGAGNATVVYPPSDGSNGIDLRILIDVDLHGEEHIDMGPFPLSL